MCIAHNNLYKGLEIVIRENNWEIRSTQFRMNKNTILHRKLLTFMKVRVLGTMKSGIGEHLSVLWMFRASSNISLHCLTLSWISIKVQAFRYFQKYSDFMFRAISNISPVSHPLLNIPIARDEAFKYFPKKFRFWREVITMQHRMLLTPVLIGWTSCLPTRSLPISLSP